MRHGAVKMIPKVNDKVGRLELWPNDWIPHHDNAPAPKALSVKQFLAQKFVTKMEHPPHSSYLAANDLRLFSYKKSALKRQRFRDTEHIQKKVILALIAIPQQQFQKCFQQWQHRWAKCIVAQEEYFEGGPFSKL
jgi:hypothetical protein